MRHAVLGAGGVGGLIAAALARAGAEVELVLRPETAASYGGRLRLESAVLGDFEVDVPGSGALRGPVDVLWVTTKATQLDAAMSLAPAEAVGAAVVIPMLNGVDHMETLRRVYRNVVAAAIRVESERAGPGLIRQKSPFLRVDMAGAPEVQEELRRAGIDCHSREDEAELLWEKLVMLAPVALATTAADAPFGDVRDSADFIGCRAETAAAARAAGAAIDLEPIVGLHELAPPELQSSMQKDVAAGREPEVDAIAGPILRLGREHGFETGSTQSLVDRITSRLS